VNNGWDRRHVKNLKKGLRPEIESCYITTIGDQDVEVSVLSPEVDYLAGVWIKDRGDVIAELLDMGEIE
jgi:hypothetical protein